MGLKLKGFLGNPEKSQGMKKMSKNEKASAGGDSISQSNQIHEFRLNKLRKMIKYFSSKPNGIP